jgi:hypothetical protein
MTIGAALGTIIAAIMTDHIRKVSGQSAHRAGSAERTRAPKPPRSCGVIGIRSRYSHASAVSAAIATHNGTRSRSASAGESAIEGIANLVSFESRDRASCGSDCLDLSIDSAVGPVDG